MAKIKVVGDTGFLEMSVSMEDLRLVNKHRPSALLLKDNEDVIFRVTPSENGGSGSISDYGIEFTSDDNGCACVPFHIPATGEEDVKAFVVDNLSGVFVMLKRVEANVQTEIPAVKTELEEFRNAIEI